MSGSTDGTACGYHPAGGAVVGDAGYARRAEPEDEAGRHLLIRLRNRDREALEELARRYGEALNRAAYLHLGDVHAAADIAQDTLLAAWDGAKRIRENTALRPWLFGILFNLCRKHGRSRIRGKRRERQAAQRRRLAPSAEERGEVEERLARLRESLRGLDERLRAVVVLRYGQGLSVAETGATLGIPEGTVKSRTHAALRLLRSALGRDDDVAGKRG